MPSRDQSGPDRHPDPTPSVGASTRTASRGDRRHHPALAELGRISLDQPLGPVLQQVSDLATQVLPDVDALSVTLVDADGSARSAAFTSRVAAVLDERQYEDGFGPCMDAARSGGVVRVRDTADDPTYPGFSALARRHEVSSVTSVGIPWAERVVGALACCTSGGDPLPEEVVELGRVFAGYAGAALANASLVTSTTELAEQVQEAMRSRAVIEQAKGVLVASLGLDPEEAFAELSRRSQRTNTTLRDLAARVVAQAMAVHEEVRERGDAGASR